MAAPRSRRGTARAASLRDGESTERASRSDAAGIVPELLRRAVGLGFSGFFTTEELVRKALGDTVPREWADFAAAQTDRARGELVERLALELRKTLDAVDIEQLLGNLLATHTIDVEARIRFAPREAGDSGEDVRIRLRREDAK